MTYKVIVEPEALQDLKSIISFITENDSLNRAMQFANELKAKMASLSDMPMRCRKSHYSEEGNTRDLIYKGYTIVFQVRVNTVHILTVFRQKAY
ncbi:MAG TPA: type II toxin-antitoxin system RelE/ParE family toxin [Epsilonproteobacteria bacterium]|nr:type II toxin-antitoxin system RelE/ParE family toxin [Campylobacterota bacterium]